MSASTFNPTDSAVIGLTAVEMTVCIWSISVQNASSPNVSFRNVSFPCAIVAGSLALSLSSSPQAAGIAPAHASSTTAHPRRNTRPTTLLFRIFPPMTDLPIHSSP
jgi:hypothetical protein